MIFTHLANYFRNENFIIFKAQKRGLNTSRKIPNTRILIVKSKGRFSYLQLMNVLLYCKIFLFLKFKNSRFENS